MIEWEPGALDAHKTAFRDALVMELAARGHDDVEVVEVYPDVAAEGIYGARLRCGTLHWSSEVSAFWHNDDFWTRTASRLLDISPLTGRP